MKSARLHRVDLLGAARLSASWVMLSMLTACASNTMSNPQVLGAGELHASAEANMLTRSSLTRAVGRASVGVYGGLDVSVLGGVHVLRFQNEELEEGLEARSGGAYQPHMGRLLGFGVGYGKKISDVEMKLHLEGSREWSYPYISTYSSGSFLPGISTTLFELETTRVSASMSFLTRASEGGRLHLYAAPMVTYGGYNMVYLRGKYPEPSAEGEVSTREYEDISHVIYLAAKGGMLFDVAHERIFVQLEGQCAVPAYRGGGEHFQYPAWSELFFVSSGIVWRFDPWE